MKKKIVLSILFIIIITINLYAKDKVLNDFLSKINNENEWIPVEYLEVIKSKNRETMKIIAPNLNYEKEWDESSDCWKEWYERYIEYYEIESIFFNEALGNSMNGKQPINKIEINKEYDYKILKLKKTSFFYLTLQQDPGSIFNTRCEWNFISPINKLRIAPLYSENPGYYDNDEYEYDEIIIDAKFIFDGDYLTVYANNDKFKQVYFRCSDETFKQLESLIYKNTIDLSKVTWPRHADGTCDYDGSSKKATPANTSQSKTSEATKAVSNTNVVVKKTMSTNCNLKLRSGEATSTRVLTVMSAGTKVKILELGKAETIDGINSNWVKVEVQKGAKDRDGKAIKAGTVGWCYGGYLE